MSKTIYKKMRQAFFTRQGPGYRLPIDGNRTNSTTYLSLPVMDLIHTAAEILFYGTFGPFWRQAGTYPVTGESHSRYWYTALDFSLWNAA